MTTKATPETEQAKPKGLAWKLAEVMGEIHRIGKAGFNTNQKYAFVRESDVSDAIRPLLAERHIWLWSSEVSREVRPLFVAASGAQMWETTVAMEFQMIDGETGEVSPKQIYSGAGADTGDKHLPKAQSMALKYYCLKTFMLSTGADDAEGDDKVDKAAAAAGARSGPVKVNKGAQEGVQRGGRSTRATTAQVTDISRQAKALGLNTVDEIIPVIVKIIGYPPAEGQEVRDWLGAMTSDQAAGIITTLAGMAVFADVSVDAPVEDVENTAQEGPEEGFTVA